MHLESMSIPLQHRIHATKLICEHMNCSLTEAMTHLRHPIQRDEIPSALWNALSELIQVDELAVLAIVDRSPYVWVQLTGALKVGSTLQTCTFPQVVLGQIIEQQGDGYLLNPMPENLHFLHQGALLTVRS